MQELINQTVTDAVLARAKELLSNGTVNRVIGWEKGLFEDDQTPRIFTSVEELDKNMKGITLSDETVEDFVGAVKTTLDTFDEMDDSEKVKVIENVKDLLDNKTEEILTQQEIQDYGTLIENAINDPNSEISEQVGNALKDLLGI